MLIWYIQMTNERKNFILFKRTFLAIIILSVFTIFLTISAEMSDIKYSATVYAENTGGLFAGGSGSEEEPYLITTPKHLDNIRERLGTRIEETELVFEPYYFALGADIDLKDALSVGGELYDDGKGWLPIGQGSTQEDYFCGFLDGRGYEIRNLWINRPDMEYVGLFGCAIDTTVVNLNMSLTPAGITGGAYAGGLFGFLDAAAYTGIDNSIKTNLIERCSVTGTLKSLSANEFSHSALGGFVGCIDNAEVKESFFAGILNGTRSYTGGIAGFAEHTAVVNSYIKAEIHTDGAAGGIFGRASNTKISVPNEISRCYVDLKNEANTDTFVGAIMSADHGVVSLSYSIGYGHFISDGKYEVNGISALDEAQLHAKASYAGFDFDNVWGIYEEIGTPYLRKFCNTVLIKPLGKTYDGTAAFDHRIEFQGDYDERKPIFAEITATGEDFINAGLYDAGVVYETEYVYQIFVAPYEITKATLNIRADDVTRQYGKNTPAFTYTVTGLNLDDGMNVIKGLEQLFLSIKEVRLRRGRYVIEITGELFAENYDFKYEIGTLTVTGFYSYEIVLIVLGGVCTLTLILYIIFLTTVKKKTFADLWRGLKKKFVKEVIKEVPVSNRLPLPANKFTAREKDVAELLLIGKSRREIAEILYISENTVKTHTQNIFEKDGIKSQKAFIAKYLLGERENQEKD